MVRSGWRPWDLCPSRYTSVSRDPVVFSMLPYISPSRRYLQNGNILAARTFISQFIAQLISSRPKLRSPLQTSPLPVTPNSEVIHTTEPLLNFCQLAVLTCQRANREKNQAIREGWVRLCGTYQSKGGVLATKEVRAVSQIITVFLSIYRMETTF